MNDIIAVLATPAHRQVIEHYLFDLRSYTELEVNLSPKLHQLSISQPERVDVCIFSSSNFQAFRGLEFSNLLIDDEANDPDIRCAYLGQLRLKEREVFYFYSPKDAYEIIKGIFKARGWYK